MALWFLEDRRDVGKAQKKYDKAIELKPDLDGCIFHVLKQALTGEREDAKELLEPVDTVSKFNVYLQVCINARKIEKAYKKYEEIDQVISMDDTSYYLLSVLEPLQSLQGINSFNVVALLYMTQKKMRLPENVTVESLERYLKRSQNKIGYVIVLIELCIWQNNLKDAKKFLHEYRPLFFRGEYYDYWYEFIVKVEENKEKLKEYEDEIIDNAELDEIRRKRLLGLFWQLDSEKDNELQVLLNDIYKQTDLRLDLMNLIFFSKTRRKWQDMLQYAEQLSKRYNDIYGNVYKIQSLVKLGEYDLAMNAIVELQEGQVIGTEEVILHYKIVIFERWGRYAEAIEAGRKLLKKKPSDMGISMER